MLVVSLGWGGVGYAHAAPADEIIASVNGEKITVHELRESLGLWGGAVPAKGIPLDKKKEGLNRLIDACLLEQSARAKGLDKTEDFSKLMKQNGQGITINALFRREMAFRAKVTEDEIKAEAGKLRKEDKNLSREEARSRAFGVVWGNKVRQIEEEVIAAAKKDTSPMIDEGAMARIEKGDPMKDNVVLGTAGSSAVLYGDVKKLLQTVPAGKHGGRELTGNPAMMRNVVNRELTRISLLDYARRQESGDLKWLKTVQREAERALLIGLLTGNVVLKGVKVTDKEIGDAYAKHSGMLVRDGKPIPLPEVKEEIRRIVQGDKRKLAIEKYVGQLRKKAKIKTYGKLITKV
ncbi:MAG TPA: hypothetical protein DD658_09015 [Deltaproteobacteria bacterium]|nr:hypothetical protein [Deltaproteobacteria bacterium]